MHHEGGLTKNGRGSGASQLHQREQVDIVVFPSATLRVGRNTIATLRQRQKEERFGHFAVHIDIVARLHTSSSGPSGKGRNTRGFLSEPGPDPPPTRNPTKGAGRHTLILPRYCALVLRFPHHLCAASRLLLLCCVARSPSLFLVTRYTPFCSPYSCPPRRCCRHSHPARSSLLPPSAASLFPYPPSPDTRQTPRSVAPCSFPAVRHRQSPTASHIASEPGAADPLTTPTTVAMSIRALRDAENVFRIEKRCVACEQAPLSCEGIKCPANQVCVQNSRTCDQCASVGCQFDPTAGDAAPSKPNVGAIAGGVIGGVAFIAILTFVVWKYCLKGKRRPMSQQSEWQDVDMSQQEKVDNDFQSRRSARASTHTVASMASSVLTRASNIIQIAYIPGVTNRSGPGSPDLLVPPVPPIPAMSPSSGMSTPYSTADQHFFVPDFRDSMMSSSTAGRTSIAPSLAQRGSVASTMYRQNAIVSPLPAQTIVRGKAAVVSVKSTATNSPAETPSMETPPVPQIDPKHTVKPIRIHMPGISPANSVRSTAQLGPVRALNITKKKSTDITPPKSSSNSTNSADRTLVNTPEVLVPSARPLTGYSTASSDDGAAHSRARRGSLASDSGDDSDDDHKRARQTLLRSNSGSDRDSEYTEFQDSTPTKDRSPFTDSSSLEPPRPMMSQRITSYDTERGLRTPMTPIVEEASASKRGSTVSNRRDQSPFSDNNKSEL